MVEPNTKSTLEERALEEYDDENELQQLLDSTKDFVKRRKIRLALKNLKTKKENENRQGNVENSVSKSSNTAKRLTEKIVNKPTDQADGNDNKSKLDEKMKESKDKNEEVSEVRNDNQDEQIASHQSNTESNTSLTISNDSGSKDQNKDSANASLTSIGVKSDTVASGVQENRSSKSASVLKRFPQAEQSDSFSKRLNRFSHLDNKSTANKTLDIEKNKRLSSQFPNDRRSATRNEKAGGSSMFQKKNLFEQMASSTATNKQKQETITTKKDDSNSTVLKEDVNEVKPKVGRNEVSDSSGSNIKLVAEEQFKPATDTNCQHEQKTIDDSVKPIATVVNTVSTRNMDETKVSLDQTPKGADNSTERSERECFSKDQISDSKADVLKEIEESTVENQCSDSNNSTTAAKNMIDTPKSSEVFNGIDISNQGQNNNFSKTKQIDNNSNVEHEKMDNEESYKSAPENNSKVGNESSSVADNKSEMKNVRSGIRQKNDSDTNDKSADHEEHKQTLQQKEDSSAVSTSAEIETGDQGTVEDIECKTTNEASDESIGPKEPRKRLPSLTSYKQYQHNPDKKENKSSLDTLAPPKNSRNSVQRSQSCKVNPPKEQKTDFRSILRKRNEQANSTQSDNKTQNSGGSVSDRIKRFSKAPDSSSSSRTSIADIIPALRKVNADSKTSINEKGSVESSDKLKDKHEVKREEGSDFNKDVSDEKIITDIELTVTTANENAKYITNDGQTKESKKMALDGNTSTNLQDSNLADENVKNITNDGQVHEGEKTVSVLNISANPQDSNLKIKFQLDTDNTEKTEEAVATTLVTSSVTEKIVTKSEQNTYVATEVTDVKTRTKTTKINSTYSSKYTSSNKSQVSNVSTETSSKIQSAESVSKSDDFVKNNLVRLRKLEEKSIEKAHVESNRNTMADVRSKFFSKNSSTSSQESSTNRMDLSDDLDLFKDIHTNVPTSQQITQMVTQNHKKLSTTSTSSAEKLSSYDNSKMQDSGVTAGVKKKNLSARAAFFNNAGSTEETNISKANAKVSSPENQSERPLSVAEKIERLRSAGPSKEENRSDFRNSMGLFKKNASSVNTISSAIQGFQNNSRKTVSVNNSGSYNNLRKLTESKELDTTINKSDTVDAKTTEENDSKRRVRGHRFHTINPTTAPPPSIVQSRAASTNKEQEPLKSIRAISVLEPIQKIPETKTDSVPVLSEKSESNETKQVTTKTTTTAEIVDSSETATKEAPPAASNNTKAATPASGYVKKIDTRRPASGRITNDPRAKRPSISKIPPSTVPKAAPQPEKKQKKGGLFDMFKKGSKSDLSKPAAGTPAPAKTMPAKTRSEGSVSAILLQWCKDHTAGYEYKDIKVKDLSRSWADGLAFCALINNLLGKDTINIDELDTTTKEKNFNLSFDAFEKVGISPLLDVEDMLLMYPRPDQRCVMTYLLTIYSRYKDV